MRTISGPRVDQLLGKEGKRNLSEPEKYDLYKYYKPIIWPSSKLVKKRIKEICRIVGLVSKESLIILSQTIKKFNDTEYSDSIKEIEDFMRSLSQDLGIISMTDIDNIFSRLPENVRAKISHWTEANFIISGQGHEEYEMRLKMFLWDPCLGVLRHLPAAIENAKDPAKIDPRIKNLVTKDE